MKLLTILDVSIEREKERERGGPYRNGEHYTFFSCNDVLNCKYALSSFLFSKQEKMHFPNPKFSIYSLMENFANDRLIISADIVHSTDCIFA